MSKKLRTESSRFWAVLGQQSPTTVQVSRCTKAGNPVSGGGSWNACAICFTNSHGKEAPPVVSGSCVNCGFTHDQEGFESDAHITSEKAPPKPRIRRRPRSA